LNAPRIARSADHDLQLRRHTARVRQHVSACIDVWLCHVHLCNAAQLVITAERHGTAQRQRIFHHTLSPACRDIERDHTAAAPEQQEVPLRQLRIFYGDITVPGAADFEGPRAERVAS
jgi:hypothetical protein